VAGALFGTEAASFAEIQIELVQPGFWRDLNRVVRTVHVAIATVKTLSTAETSFSLIDDRLEIEGRIDFLEMLQPHVDRQGFLFKASFLLIIIGIEIFRVDDRWSCQPAFHTAVNVIFDGGSSTRSLPNGS